MENMRSIKLPMANLITLVRLASTFVIAAIALHAEPRWQLLNVPLVIINILLDGLDGIVARLRNEVSVFGAVFDIAADRIIEITLWVVLAKVGMVSIWIALFFLTRGVLVDSLRKPHTDQGKTPFGMMRTPLGKFLVASRTMRCAIGLMKLITFSWLFFLLSAAEIWPQLAAIHSYLFNFISNSLICTSVTICLVRGIPVIIESIMSPAEKDRV